MLILSAEADTRAVDDLKRLRESMLAVQRWPVFSADLAENALSFNVVIHPNIVLVLVCSYLAQWLMRSLCCIFKERAKAFLAGWSTSDVMKYTSTGARRRPKTLSRFARIFAASSMVLTGVLT